MSREAGLPLATPGLQGSRVVRGLAGYLTCLKAAKSICSSITRGGAKNFTLNCHLPLCQGHQTFPENPI